MRKHNHCHTFQNKFQGDISCTLAMYSYIWDSLMLKECITGRRLNLTLGLSYLQSFRSSLQSHSFAGIPVHSRWKKIGQRCTLVGIWGPSQPPPPFFFCFRGGFFGPPPGQITEYEIRDNNYEGYCMLWFYSKLGIVSNKFNLKYLNNCSNA